jgi:hypothetical protein
MSTPVYDPQVTARSWALSTHSTPYVRRRRYTSARHFVEVWLKLEALVATARSSLGPQLDALELGWVEVGAQAPEGYEPMDDLVECREVLRYCLAQSLHANAWGEFGLHRPREMWAAWWLLRVRGGTQRDVCSQINTRIADGELGGSYISSHEIMEKWARKVDALIEGELFERWALVRNVVKEVE